MKRIATLFMLLIAASAFAQMGPPKPVKQIEAISKLEYMQGKWAGEGWIIMAGQKMTFKGTETVTSKLDNSVLLVEGNFSTRRTGGTVDIPVHVTLGVISFDPAQRRYTLADDPGLALDPQLFRDLLAAADRPLTRDQLLAAWPAGTLRPAPNTLWRWLQKDLALGRLHSQGTGRRGDPLRYRMAGPSNST